MAPEPTDDELCDNDAWAKPSSYLAALVEEGVAEKDWEGELESWKS